MHTRQNFEVLEGQDNIVTISVTDATGQPVHLLSTIAAATWVVSPSLNSLDAALTKTLGSGISLADDGTATVTVNYWDGLQYGTYYHELLLTEFTGATYSVSRGILYVRRSVVTND